MTSGIQTSRLNRSASSHYEQRQRRRNRRLGYDGWPIRLDQIADRENLYRCFRLLEREGGHAPGRDGIRFADLSPMEVGANIGELSRTLTVQTSGRFRYRPQRPLSRRIPKPHGGHRELKIGSIWDRVVAKALDLAFKDYWETVFLPGSFGFRPGRSTWGLLANLEAAMIRTGRRVLAIDDIRTAFDTVPIAAVLDCHRQALEGITQAHFGPEEKQRTLALVDTVLRGHDPNRQRGIDQGGCYSPTALNVLLHYYHDRPMEERPILPWYRYADNLTYLCQDMSEGREILHRSCARLEPLGMTLKGEEGARDLGAGGEAQVLGFILSWRGGSLHYETSDKALGQLQQDLQGAQLGPNPAVTTAQVALGWIEAMGPALEDGNRMTDLTRALANSGIREISPTELQWYRDQSRTHWIRYRARILEQGNQEQPWQRRVRLRRRQ
jgi:retron-type reverse transcriptase